MSIYFYSFIMLQNALNNVNTPATSDCLSVGGKDYQTNHDLSTLPFTCHIILDIYFSSITNGIFFSGRYYKFDTCGAPHSDSIMSDQLVGHWYLSLSGSDSEV